MGKKIPKQVVLERRKKVWDLRQRGYTYELIAKEVGISNAAVCKILQRITKKYQERHLEDVDRVKAEQVAELEQVGFEAYQAWERSKEAAKLVRQKKAVSSNGDPLGVSEQTLESRDQDGDPRYLQVYMKAKEDIRKIMGADAPVKSEITGKNGEPISIEGRIDQIASLFDQARERRNSSESSDDRSGNEAMEAAPGSTNSSLLQQS